MTTERPELASSRPAVHPGPGADPGPVAGNWGPWINRLGPLLALLVIHGFFAALAPEMLSLRALEIITIQTVIVGTAAVGMTVVIISRGIDLSVGSIIAFSSVVAAGLLRGFALPLPVPEAVLTWHVWWLHVPPIPALPAVMCGVLAGGVCGLFNAFIITRAKVVPFIVTLGTLLVIRGAAKGLAQSAPINIDNEWITSFVRTLAPSERWRLLPAGAWAMIVLAGAFWALLRYTKLGRHTFAIGSNEQTARLCGVAVERVKLWVYGLSGACAGLAGVMLLSRQRQGDPTGAMGYELDVIAAVVIGGGSLAGGEGSIFGSIVGALIMTVIRTGCNLQGQQTWVTQVVAGVIIIIAVALDRLRHRRVA